MSDEHKEPNRRDYVRGCDLDPASLVGSWFLKLENRSVSAMGQVLGEPHSGPTLEDSIYLCEFYWTDGMGATLPADTWQQLVRTSEMCGASESDWTVEYRFYDTEERMRAANAAERARESA